MTMNDMSREDDPQRGDAFEGELDRTLSDDREDEFQRLLFAVPVPAERMRRLKLAWPASLVDSDLREGGEPTHRRSNREWLMIGGAVAMIALSLCVAVWMALPSGWELVDRQELGGLARNEWSARMSNEWRELKRQDSDRHRSSSFLMQSPSHWQFVETSLDPNAVVFDLRLKHGQTGKLFALRSDQRLKWLPTKPPTRPQDSRDGSHIAAWQEGDLVYVMKVDGPAYVYRNAIRSRRTSYARFGR